MFLVGGAAMAFADNTRRSTRDVDAVFEPKETVRDAAAVVADRRGISRDWLNDAVKGYLGLTVVSPTATTTRTRSHRKAEIAASFAL